MYALKLIQISKAFFFPQRVITEHHMHAADRL